MSDRIANMCALGAYHLVEYDGNAGDLCGALDLDVLWWLNNNKLMMFIYILFDEFKDELNWIEHWSHFFLSNQIRFEYKACVKHRLHTNDDICGCVERVTDPYRHPQKASENANLFVSNKHKWRYIPIHWRFIDFEFFKAKFVHSR